VTPVAPSVTIPAAAANAADEKSAASSKRAGKPPVAGESMPAADTLGAATGNKPLQSYSANAKNVRARAMGDSIANARAIRSMGLSKTDANGGDTLVGIVVLHGTPPAARAMLSTDGGHKLISLSGLASEGLTNVAGAQVVVHGIKISALDVVVSSYGVRTVQSAPVVDGKLRSAAGEWTLDLSDKSGVKRLTSVPKDLQLAVNARVWIVFEPGTSTPKLFGVISNH
ncbi:MAG: hypothetical protein M3Y64_05660, partial [Gemmatimonadota bacterium]|nr:hypothetical protein [Gemmatimonadota bacterium]